METTKVAYGAWNAKHAKCPDCGSSVGPAEVIETLPAPNEGAAHVVDCPVCRKHSRFLVAG